MASWCNHGTIPWKSIKATHLLWGPLALCPPTSSWVVLSSLLILSHLHLYTAHFIFEYPIHILIITLYLIQTGFHLNVHNMLPVACGFNPHSEALEKRLDFLLHKSSSLHDSPSILELKLLAWWQGNKIWQAQQIWEKLLIETSGKLVLLSLVGKGSWLCELSVHGMWSQKGKKKDLMNV